MSFRLREIIKDPDKRAVISWLGGGAVVVAAGIWTVFTFVVEHKDASGKKDGTNITVSGQGIVSGRDTNITGPSKEQIEQIQKPLTEQLGQKDTQIAALTKMLLEKNPVPAGLGTPQAVGAAVQSIAQGAAEGDPRLKQALALLKENKVGEATQLLSSIAETTFGGERADLPSEKERKEEAIAYRNLGAIAGLADPKWALEAYEKAIALDPDDLESLLWAGSIQIDHDDIKKAQSRLERVLTLAKSDDQAYYKYWALIGLGDIKNQRGDLAGALKSFNDGLAIIEPLAKANPGNATLQRDLSVSYEKVDDVQKAKGDLADALKSYNDSLAIRDQLAKSEPGNAGWQRDLSLCYDKIGDVQRAQGNLAGALKFYKDSLAIRVPLAKSDPGNASWQRDLSVSYQRIGDVQVAQGDLAAALKSHQDSLAIIDRLANSDPGNAGWQRDLSASYNNVGDVQMAKGDIAAALKFYQDGLAIRVRLAKSDPGNAGRQRDLSLSFRNLASVHRQSGDSAKALDFLRQGHAIMARLTKLSPDNAEWAKDFAEFNQEIAEIAPSRLEHGRNPRTPLLRR